MKYVIDKKWFKENGSDLVEYSRAGTNHRVTVTADMNMSDKFMGVLYSLKRPYIYLTDDCSSEKTDTKVAPRACSKKKKSKKVKINEPKSTKEELQKEVSPEASETEE